MSSLGIKCTAFAGAVFVSVFVLVALGYCFALQSNAHLTPVALAKAVVTRQWLS